MSQPRLPPLRSPHRRLATAAGHWRGRPAYQVAKHTPAVGQQSRCSDRTTAAVFQRLQGVLWCHAGFQPGSEELRKYEGKCICTGDLKLCSGEQTISCQQCFDGTSGVVLLPGQHSTEAAATFALGFQCSPVSIIPAMLHTTHSPVTDTILCVWWGIIKAYWAKPRSQTFCGKNAVASRLIPEPPTPRAELKALALCLDSWSC